jgi:predicted Zn-dependent protease
MASPKVNTKFAIILSLAVLALVAGAGALVVWSQFKSAERNFSDAERLTAEAETLMQQGAEDEAYELFNRAQKQYGIAVSKQQTNLEYVREFRDALLRTRPDTESRYQQYFFQDYFGAVNTLARQQPTDPQAQLDFVELLDERIRKTVDRSGWDSGFVSLIADVTTRLERLPDEDDPIYKLLRGYRGAAQVERIQRTRVDDEDRLLALEDLQVAYEAHPDRTDFAAAMIRWHVGEFLTQRAGGRDSRAETALEEGVELANQLAATHPESPAILATTAAIRVAGPQLDRANQTRRQELAEQYNDARRRVLEQLLSLDPEDVTLKLLRATENMTLRGGGDLVERFADRLMETRGNSPQHLLYAALMHRSRNDNQGALAAYEQIVEMPLPELSFAGVLLPQFRVQAALGQAQIALNAYRRTGDPDEREQALADAKRYRERAAELVNVNRRGDLKLVDAEIALIEDRPEEARRLFSELRTDRGDQPQILIGLARCASALGNLDQAQDLYERVLDSPTIGLAQSESLEYRVELADIYARKGENERALEVIREVRAIVGEDNEFLADRERRLQQFIVERIRLERARLERELADAEPGTGEARRLEIELQAARQREERYAGGIEADPVLRTLGDVSLLVDEGRLPQAEETLRDAIDRIGDDARLHQALIRVLRGAGDDEATRAAVAVARERFPDAEVFRQMEMVVAGGVDQYQLTLDLIDDNQRLSDVDKLVEKARAAATYNREDEFDRFLAQAEAADDSDPAVLELRFSRLLQQRDFDAATDLLDRARAENADQVEGLYFEGRLELAQDDFDDAASLFRQATERIPGEPSFWRYLGVSLAGAGQVDQAIAAFQQAMTIRSDDADIARDYALALTRAGRQAEALAVIGRDSDVFTETRNNPRLRELWLTLEAQAGDAELATNERAERFEEDPTDGANAIRYLRLLIDARRLADARSVLGQIAANEEAKVALGRAVNLPPDVAITALEASSLAAAGRVMDGAALWERRLPTLVQTSLGPSPYTAFAEYLLDHVSRDPAFQTRAFELLELARDRQSARREVDRAIAQAALNRAEQIAEAASDAARVGDTGRAERLESNAVDLNERAVQGIRRVLEAEGLDDDDRLRLRRGLAETLVRLERYDQAEAAVERIAAEQPDGLETLLLSARVDRLQGDDRSARQTLNRAVELHPDDHRPFLTRALLNQSEEALFADVIADLDRVHELNPSLIDAWRIRFTLLSGRGNLDQAFADVRQAIADFPGAAEPLRQVLVNQLAVTGRELEAATQAVRYADNQPENMYWQSRAGELSLQVGQYRNAARVLERLYNSEQITAREDVQRQAARLLLDAKLRSGVELTPGEMLRLVDATKADDDEPGVEPLMLEARVRERLEQPRDALNLARQAYEAAGDRQAALDSWWSQLTLLLEEPSNRRAFIDRLDDEVPPLIRVRLLREQLFAEGATDEMAARIEEEMARAQSAGRGLAVLEASRALAVTYYLLDRPDDILRVAETGLALSPNDPELNNAVAFTLAKFKDDAEAATPYAERTYAYAQNNPGSLDTVGLVWLKTGRAGDAVGVLERARSLTDNPNVLLPINIHLAMAMWATGDEFAARDALDAAVRAAERATQQTRDRYAGEIEQLRSEIES